MTFATALGITPVLSAAAAPPVPGGCAWLHKFTSDSTNIAYPDSAANYWVSANSVPRGGYLEVHGSYPHARYASLATYDTSGQSIDGLADTMIRPDVGSTNPYHPGAERNAVARNFTVRVVDGRVPSVRTPNTLYTRTADGSRTSVPGSAALLWRVYVPDSGLNQAGGVALPALTAVDSRGIRTSLPLCAGSTPTPFAPQNSALGQTGAAEPNKPAGSYGTNPPVWHRFTGIANTVATVTGGGVVGVPSQIGGSGGFFDNPDNKYVFTTADFGFGDVLVLRGRAPTTPHTVAGNPIMGTGQLRYWSLCTEDVPTTGYLGCAFDEQVPLDRNGYYTVMISAANRRPSNATAACGVTWLPAGTRQQTMILLRNMLPDSDFTQSVQNTKPGAEAATMGPFLPAGRYLTTTDDAERIGCHSS